MANEREVMRIRYEWCVAYYLNVSDRIEMNKKQTWMWQGTEPWVGNFEPGWGQMESFSNANTKWFIKHKRFIALHKNYIQTQIINVVSKTQILESYQTQTLWSHPNTNQNHKWTLLKSHPNTCKNHIQTQMLAIYQTNMIKIISKHKC